MMDYSKLEIAKGGKINFNTFGGNYETFESRNGHLTMSKHDSAVDVTASSFRADVSNQHTITCRMIKRLA